jgi:hypothetical protein
VIAPSGSDSRLFSAFDQAARTWSTACRGSHKQVLQGSRLAPPADSSSLGLTVLEFSGEAEAPSDCTGGLDITSIRFLKADNPVPVSNVHVHSLKLARQEHPVVRDEVPRLF